MGDPGSALGSGRSPGEEHGDPLEYCCLENPMDRGARPLVDTWHRLPLLSGPPGLYPQMEHILV